MVNKQNKNNIVINSPINKKKSKKPQILNLEGIFKKYEVLIE